MSPTHTFHAGVTGCPQQIAIMPLHHTCRQTIRCLTSGQFTDQSGIFIQQPLILGKHDELLSL